MYIHLQSLLLNTWMWAAAATEPLKGKSFGEFSGSYISTCVFIDSQDCHCEQSIF